MDEDQTVAPTTGLDTDSVKTNEYLEPHNTVTSSAEMSNKVE